MVDALRETWRVLVPGGVLLDWRPLHQKWTLEVLSGRQARVAGLMDDSPKLMDDLAADQTVAQVIGEGWFARERRHSFDYAWYWDSLSQMKRHLEEPAEGEWHPPVRLPQAVSEQAQRLGEGCSEGPRVRVRFKMRMSRYRKRAIVCRP
jgi:hypothetical protein